MFAKLLFWSTVLGLCLSPVATWAQPLGQDDVRTSSYRPSAAHQWLEILLEVAARDVERVGARPTILSRQMALPLTAVYDAWALYDDKAVPTVLDRDLRRPPAERTLENRETAIAYAIYVAMLDQFPEFRDDITQEMRRMGYDSALDGVRGAAAMGVRAGREVLESRADDGANQYGGERGSDGTPYSDYTRYKPVNSADRLIDPDCWQPIPFSDGKGGHFSPGFLTPHWYRVRPCALECAEQFRPGPPPKVGSEQLLREVQECIDMNANLSVEEKALVEFMRDGPRSTGQSGHWLHFALAISKRDRQSLDDDVKLFFAVGNCAMDAFIASWDSKRFYDSSRPWTLVRHYFQGQTIRGWAGPGEGVRDIRAEEWHPYSPDTFVTPPFPGYTSGHSTVSGACAEMIKLFTGSDECGLVEHRKAGSMTEEGFDCRDMQKRDGTSAGAELSCDVHLNLPTFTETANMAGISRVLGGYHIQADNIAGLELGRKVARYSWPVYQSYFEGTAGRE